MEAKHALRSFDALSHIVRLKIFQLLVARGDDGCSASDLCKQMELAPATLSFHMSKMVNSELVSQQKTGRTIAYYANVDNINNTAGFLRSGIHTPNNANCRTSQV
jgi:ArsR family transcriptional regulator